MSSLSVTMIVGAYREDIENPQHNNGAFIAGCIDDGTIDVMGADEAEEWIDSFKQKYEFEPGAIVWREVRVNLSRFDFDALFDQPTLKGEIAS